MEHSHERILNNLEDYIFCDFCQALNYTNGTRKRCRCCGTKLRKIILKDEADIEEDRVLQFIQDSIQEYLNDVDWENEYDLSEYEPHFISDNDLMVDFFQLTKGEFLFVNKATTKEEYENVRKIVEEFEFTLEDFNGDNLYYKEMEV